MSYEFFMLNGDTKGARHLFIKQNFKVLKYKPSNEKKEAMRFS